jgi:hypothetical protein
VQLGERSGARHFAYAVAGDVVYRAAVAAGLGAELGASLGSGPTSNGRVDELDNFYPTNHKFYGFMDLFGLRNLVEGHVGVSVKPRGSRFSLGLRGFAFAKQRALGRWSNAGGATLGAAGANTTDDRFVGIEADLFGTFEATEYLMLLAGYSAFVPGGAADAVGHSDPQHWAFLQIALATP